MSWWSRRQSGDKKEYDHDNDNIILLNVQKLRIQTDYTKKCRLDFPFVYAVYAVRKNVGIKYE